MADRLIAVLDVGKTLAKLSLWNRAGAMLARETRSNARVTAKHYATLDIEGIEAWLAETLRAFGRIGAIGAIIPVGHGAAAVLVRDGRLVCPPMDYEAPIPEAARQSYDAARDSFAITGSPALPDGLNLGSQLHYLSALVPTLWEGGTQILLWPQYWAWRLCRVAASEVTSLGCHTDLWSPQARAPSPIAVARGWAAHLPPLRPASAILGTLRCEWAERCGLPADVAVHCGLHDSNAALLAARGFPEIAGQEATILSTGTWFVAMRSPGEESAVDLARLAENRDCLVNVDAYGQCIPSARFMGGREIERLIGPAARRLDYGPDQPTLLAAAPIVVARGTRVLPSFAPGFGPFPALAGRWVDRPDDALEQRAAVALYAALVADVALDLIGARERIVVEGRFAEARLFVRALASLRPDAQLFTSNAHNDVSYGALRLLEPALRPNSALTRAEPLPLSLDAYRTLWRRAVEQLEQAA